MHAIVPRHRLSSAHRERLNLRGAPQSTSHRYMRNAPEMAPPSVPRRFGRFELRPSEGALFADGAPITLGARAFDVLAAFVDRPGTLITKDDLLATVWPGLVVEENNL